MSKAIALWMATVIAMGAGLAGAQVGEGRQVWIAPAFSRPIAVEMRSQATAVGEAVQLREIARWNEADEPAMTHAGQLAVARFAAGQKSISVDLNDVKQTLEDAGVNLGSVQFSGAVRCQVERQARTGSGGSVVSALLAEAQERPIMAAAVNAAESALPPQTGQAALAAVRSLRDILSGDLAARLGVAAEDVQLMFSPDDEKVARLSEPLCRFEIRPRGHRTLGEVSWDVTVVGASGRESVVVTAAARVWQTQLVTKRAMAFKQVFSGDDVGEKRVLTDRITPETQLRREQVIGGQASRDLGPGAVIDSRMVEAVQVVRVGELITVTVQNGGVQVKWVAEARESGGVGQRIRVRRPQSREELEVVITGPQTARFERR